MALRTRAARISLAALILIGFGGAARPLPTGRFVTVEPASVKGEARHLEALAQRLRPLVQEVYPAARVEIRNDALKITFVSDRYEHHIVEDNHLSFRQCAMLSLEMNHGNGTDARFVDRMVSEVEAYAQAERAKHVVEDPLDEPPDDDTV